jgi:hypothetical protein
MQLHAPLILFLAFLPSITFAGDCQKLAFCFVCGKVENKTAYTMKITQNPSDQNSKTTSARPHWCDIYNWSGTPWKDFHSCPNRPCICKQETLAPHSSKGGNVCRSNHPDVDAFCFADRDYVVVNPGGGNRRVRKGVWTRIHNNEKAVCNYGLLDGSGTGYCKIIKD